MESQKVPHEWNQEITDAIKDKKNKLKKKNKKEEKLETIDETKIAKPSTPKEHEIAPIPMKIDKQNYF